MQIEISTSLKDDKDEKCTLQEVFSTSLFTRLNKNGLKISCSASTTSLLFSPPSEPVSFSHKNCPNLRSPRISRHIKFNSANSSFKLFCKQGACDDQPPMGNERTDYLRQDRIDILDAMHFIDDDILKLEGECLDEADLVARES